jgi:lipopolysaccharide transport system ATP-binding protein
MSSLNSIQPPVQSNVQSPTQQPLVQVEQLGKCYRRMHSDRPRTIMEAALAGFRKLRAAERFWALQDVSFNVMPGEMVGVLGHNGAGKSTLLQILSGIVRPDVGRVQVTGRMGALLDLGSGFHEDLTGRENVFINAIIGGLTRAEATKRFNQILEFAELEDFIDNPLRTYSAGMQMRLGFAVAIHTNPDVLFIDEFLSVGDLAFQSKCLDRILELKRNGCAIVLISHNPDQVKELCDRAIWLDQGQIRQIGEPSLIVPQYVSQMNHQATAPQKQDDGFSHLANLRHVALELPRTARLNESPHGPLIASGDGLGVTIDYQIPAPIATPIISLCLCDEAGQMYFNTHSQTQIELPDAVGTHQVHLRIDRLDLPRGNYYVNVGLHSPDWQVTHDYHGNRHPIGVESEFYGEHTLLSPPRQWQVISPVAATI